MGLFFGYRTMSANQQPAEIRTLADLIHEAQMLSSVLYGHGENKGFIHEFREVTATLREEHSKLRQLSNNIYSSTAERIAEVESSTDYILQALRRVESSTAKLSALEDPDHWVEQVKSSMAIRFAEDPFFELIFTRMAEAAMTRASERFFTDLDRQMVTVMREVVTSEGIGKRRLIPHADGKLRCGEVLQLWQGRVGWALLGCASLGLIVALFHYRFF